MCCYTTVQRTRSLFRSQVICIDSASFMTLCTAFSNSSSMSDHRGGGANSETDTIGSVVGSVGVRGRGQGHESPTFERFSSPTVRGSLGFRGGFCGVGVFGKDLGVTGGVQPTGLGFVGGGVFLVSGVLRFLRGAGIGVGGLCDDSRVVGARTGGVGGRFLRPGGGGGFQDGGG